MICIKCRNHVVIEKELDYPYYCPNCDENMTNLEVEPEFELNKVHNTDCMKALKILDDKCIDLVIIDPPYELDNHGGGKTDFASRKLVKDLHIDFISNGFDMEKVFGEMIRVSKTENFIIFCSNKQISKTMNFFENKKLSTTLLVWEKTNPVPFGNGKYISSTEYMIYVRGKNATHNNTGYKNKLKTFRYGVPSSKSRLHPTEKPVELLERLIKIHSNEGDIILDCFAGSGSTGEASIKLNRRFIGIEIDKEFSEKANKRLDAVSVNDEVKE